MADIPGQFVTAAREEESDEDNIPVPITIIKMGWERKNGERTGEQVEVDRLETVGTRPKGAIWVLTIAAMGERSQIDNRFAAYIDFVTQSFPPDDAQWIIRRLWDNQDAYDIADIEQLCDYLIEQWSANPTGSPSASPSTPSPTGRRSTAHSQRRAAASAR